MMKRRHLRILFVTQFCICAAVAAADSVLTVHAIEASIQISPRDPSQPQLALPALDVAVIAKFSCTVGVTAESITVSVADTHIRFSAVEIADATSLKASLQLPADQIAPISTDDFCVEDVASGNEQLLIPGVASAQVSLRCRSESESYMRFASVALPLRLHCTSDEAQGSSTDK